MPVLSLPGTDLSLGTSGCVIVALCSDVAVVWQAFFNSFTSNFHSWLTELATVDYVMVTCRLDYIQ